MPTGVVDVLFNVLAPVAVLVGLGATVGPRLSIDAGSLSRLAYWVFGPAFVFALLAGADLDGSLVIRLIGAALAGMGAALVVAVVWARVSGAGYELGAATTMTSIWGNVGNAGLAIVAFALGDDALPVAGVLMVSINLASLVIGVGMAQARQSSILGAVARGLTAPMSISGAVALIVNLSGIDLPLLAERSIGLLSDALIPVMLFTLGLQLISSGRPQWSNDLAVVLVAKLAVAPAAAWFVGSSIGLTGDPLAATVIQSAMPPAVFCAVVAAENNLMPERVTAAVVLATVVSAFTLPVVLVAL
jgi:predicted permease